RARPDAEIYIVAHSEGTVVAFLGLLMALSKSDMTDMLASDDSKCESDDGKLAVTYDWINQVRGLMTIGSPLDKHIFLWPTLWNDFKRPAEADARLPLIHWRNYYDDGDPIGANLNMTRDWLHDNGWVKSAADDNSLSPADVFEFKAAHDYGFS